MAATKDDIERWFLRGRATSKDCMIVVCDTYDWEDYPVFTTLSDFKDKYKEFDGVNMQKIMEVYDLSKDMIEQLSLKRCFNYPEGWKK